MRTFVRNFLACSFGVVLCATSLVRASGPAGCYVIVEKVILEPNETSPQRIQVWGLFALSDGKPGNGYLGPQSGYMYFTLDRSREQQTLAEWSDLKMMAGTGSVITFAERPSWNGRLRKATDKPESPDPYPLYNGITRVSQGRGLGSIDNPAVVAQLKAAIKPVR